MNINEARLQWEKAAPGWAKWETVISDAASLVTDKMLEMAGITLGSRVLDLASGAGSQTLIAAKRVGPNGHIVANDISPTKQNLIFKMPHANESLLMMQEAFGAYRAVIADSPEAVQKVAWKEVLEYLKSLETSKGLEAPTQVLIGSAQKPA